jgi:hypothetical protein
MHVYLSSGSYNFFNEIAITTTTADMKDPIKTPNKKQCRFDMLSRQSLPNEE